MGVKEVGVEVAGFYTWSTAAFTVGNHQEGATSVVNVRRQFKSHEQPYGH